MLIVVFLIGGVAEAAAAATVARFWGARDEECCEAFECVGCGVDGGGFRCTQQFNSMGVGEIRGGTIRGLC